MHAGLLCFEKVKRANFRHCDEAPVVRPSHVAVPFGSLWPKPEHLYPSRRCSKLKVLRTSSTHSELFIR